jgi:hypothetical protein
MGTLETVPKKFFAINHYKIIVIQTKDAKKVEKKDQGKLRGQMTLGYRCRHPEELHGAFEA